MKLVLILAQALCAISVCLAQSPKPQLRLEAEYYVVAYAQHYRVPVGLARAVVVRESNWQPCATSPKGAAGLMQLMPATAKRLGATDRCNLDQNVSGGVAIYVILEQTPKSNQPVAPTSARKSATPNSSNVDQLRQLLLLQQELNQSSTGNQATQ
jgi:soluble lytic murein transglycosylase-like protein